ncbi:uncharacterized protein LOC142234186 [Haematobia irritans]|uniref:uncharacterized protein LOC142234186 n=1 Tax=Haematobia irritans TaxID=7368 RepID=UPI003F4FF472
MPVAVGLVEVMTLVTLLGILTVFSIFIVLAHRLIVLLLFLIAPLAYVVNNLLDLSEKIVVTSFGGLLNVLNSVRDTM